MPFRPPRASFVVALLLLLALAALGAAPVTVSSSLPRPPVLHARSAILVEARTGAVLFEKNADERIPPASLTKLMTLHLVLEEISAGRLDLQREIVPSKDAWATSMPAGSSLMFLGPGQRLSVDQLLKGLVVDSGNDAAIAVAEVVAGSVPAFVSEMNQEAEALGYADMRFFEPAGLSPANFVTARSFAGFCRFFIREHPETLKSLFSLKEFTYPLAENLTEGNVQTPVTQRNRNSLLGKYAGVDGLKTGHIDESGYSIAVTAQRGDMRLISVMLGVLDTPKVSGEVLRAYESEALLDYGYDNFTLLEPVFAAPQPVKVWKGRARSVLLAPAGGAPVVAVPKNDVQRVQAVVQQEKQVQAPVNAGKVLGHVVVTLGGAELARFPLVASTAVPTGSLVRRAVDSVILFLHLN
jgi:serine-type D-Ala-D-Ala carboxypeptidase (penicillin-binding protein 5/6)